MTLRLEIVTPEEIVYNDEVEGVVLPTRNGEVGILPGHIPLLTMVEPGEIQVTRQGATVNLAVDKGFAQVYANKISILTEAAINVEKIDPAEAEAAVRRALETLEAAKKEKQIDPAELERLEAAARFAVTKQLVRKRH